MPWSPTTGRRKVSNGWIGDGVLTHIGTAEENDVRHNDIEVINPLGLPGTQTQAIAPRLESLAGKTIGEVYNHHFKGDQMFGLYRQLFKQHYPGVRVVPYTDLPASFVGGDTAYHRRVAQEVAALAKAKGCDALISGNGG